jgi:hypothetical protein
MSDTGQKTRNSARQQAAELSATLDRVRGITDGCTLAPEHNFSACCIEHDIHYRENPDHITRGEADARLRRCIAGKNHATLAWIYWLAVRIFGRKAWKK